MQHPPITCHTNTSCSQRESESERETAHQILLPRQHSPFLSHPFHQRELSAFARPLFSFRSLSGLSRDLRGTVRTASSGRYRESRVRRSWLMYGGGGDLIVAARRSEPLQLLDELRIWTNREAVGGGAHGHRRTQRAKKSRWVSVTTSLIACVCFFKLGGVVCNVTGDWSARALTLFFLWKTPTRWKLIKVSALPPPLTPTRSSPSLIGDDLWLKDPWLCFSVRRPCAAGNAKKNYAQKFIYESGSVTNVTVHVNVTLLDLITTSSALNISFSCWSAFFFLFCCLRSVCVQLRSTDHSLKCRQRFTVAP